MIERTGISDWRVDSIVANDIVGHRDQLSDFQIAILAKGIQGLHVFFSTDVQRVVDRYENPTIVDERTDFVDQARAFIDLVHFAFGCCRKEWRINDDAIKRFAGALEFTSGREEVCGDEITFVDGKAVQLV